jgi:hypothetical protein
MFLMLAMVLLAGARGQAWANSSHSPLDAGTVRLVTPDGTPINIVEPEIAAGTSSTIVKPWEDSSVTTGEGSISLPAGATSEPGTLTALGINVTSLPGPGGSAVLRVVMDVNFYDANGNLVAHPQFLRPVTICFNAPDAGDDTDVEFLDESQTPAMWVSVPTTRSNGQVCASVTHLTLFGVVAGANVPGALPRTGPAGNPASLPRTGEPEQPIMPMWLLALVGLVLISGMVVMMRARRGHSS